MAVRDFDIVVFGSSGFTGGLVVEYLWRHYGNSIKIAAAGRNEAKIRKQLDEIANVLSKPEVCDTPIIIADATDQDALDSMAARASVVLSTTGPFWNYGSGVVAACVAKGTDYVDITGESTWVREMIDKHHEQATANKCRIVSFCGFDSIPSDLGAFMVADEMLRKHNTTPVRIDTYASMKGGFSGGTAASFMNVLEKAGKSESKVLKEMGSPYELLPREARPKLRQPNVTMPAYAEDIGRYICPFVMASVNSKVVHRTNHLLGQRYGANFKYCEQMVAGAGFKGLATGAVVTGSLGLFVTGAWFSLTRPLVKWMLPEPGEGPSRKERDEGRFTYTIIAKGEKTDTETPVVKGKVGATQDPGYGATSMMIAESALCLIKNKADLSDHYGCVTPAAAMAQPLMERLRSKGMTFEIANEAAPQAKL